MNRRAFTTSLLATAAMPALPMPSVGTAAKSAASAPKSAKFWAIYLSRLHGAVSPHTLGQFTGLNAASAAAAHSQLITGNVITPGPKPPSTGRLSAWLDRIGDEDPNAEISNNQPVSPDESM